MQRPPLLLAALVSHLGDALPGVTVASRVPAKFPTRMIRVGVGDGSRVNLAQINPVCTFECWAESDDKAEDLAADAWSLINACDGEFIGPVERRVWVASADPRIPYQYPDPTYDTRFRWQFYCQMTVTLKETA